MCRVRPPTCDHPIRSIDSGTPRYRTVRQVASSSGMERESLLTGSTACEATVLSNTALVPENEWVVCWLESRPCEYRSYTKSPSPSPRPTNAFETMTLNRAKLTKPLRRNCFCSPQNRDFQDESFADRRCIARCIVRCTLWRTVVSVCVVSQVH